MRPRLAGARLVPEVARGFLKVSGGGRVYTFTLKKTYRFSNGKRITAANYAAAINRTIVLRRNRFYRGPRPHGVGQIVFDIGLSPAMIKLTIDRGATDHGPVPPAAPRRARPASRRAQVVARSLLRQPGQLDPLSRAISHSVYGLDLAALRVS